MHKNFSKYSLGGFYIYGKEGWKEKWQYNTKYGKDQEISERFLLLEFIIIINLLLTDRIYY